MQMDHSVLVQHPPVMALFALMVIRRIFLLPIRIMLIYRIHPIPHYQFARSMPMAHWELVLWTPIPHLNPIRQSACLTEILINLGKISVKM